MQAGGWDVVSHPQTGTPLPELSPEEQRAEIRETKRWLLDNGFEAGSRFVIWPYNSAGSSTFDIASEYHYLGFGGGQIGNGVRVTGPFTISRVDGDSVETSKRMIDPTARYNLLTVLMFHRIGTSEDRVSTAEFRSVVEHVDDADVDVITATELWENYLAP